ncbi:MAG: biotin synthase BioB [Nitrospirae bacterium]|nr:biotin synthase BioB [Nitrospirota bacterium]
MRISGRSAQQSDVIASAEARIIGGLEITRDEALSLASISGNDIFDLFSSSNRLRGHFRGESIDLCTITNARSGACPEDCAYCAQSFRSSAEIPVYPLSAKDQVIEKAREARAGGAKRFCIVTSGRKAAGPDLRSIAAMVSEIRLLGILPCATLGLLTKDELEMLKDSGLERFHHNLETSERFFPEICTTHTYKEKLQTISWVKESGLSLCSGGIFGLGETWDDRIDMAFALREISPDSVPVNFLTPIRGTRLGDKSPLAPLEALKIISLYRFILPDKEIRVCGGRMLTLGEFNSFIFFAGADGLLTGNYLTTTGRGFEDDLRLIHQYGLRVG